MAAIFWLVRPNLKVGGGNAILIVGQFVLDQLPRELRLPLALTSQPLQKLKTEDNDLGC